MAAPAALLGNAIRPSTGGLGAAPQALDPNAPKRQFLKSGPFVLNTSPNQPIRFSYKNASAETQQAITSGILNTFDKYVPLIDRSGPPTFNEPRFVDAFGFAPGDLGNSEFRLPDPFVVGYRFTHPSDGKDYVIWGRYVGNGTNNSQDADPIFDLWYAAPPVNRPDWWDDLWSALEWLVTTLITLAVDALDAACKAGAGPAIEQLTGSGVDPCAKPKPKSNTLLLVGIAAAAIVVVIVLSSSSSD